MEMELNAPIDRSEEILLFTRRLYKLELHPAYLPTTFPAKYCKEKGAQCSHRSVFLCVHEDYSNLNNILRTIQPFSQENIATERGLKMVSSIGLKQFLRLHEVYVVYNSLIDEPTYVYELELCPEISGSMGDA